LSIWLVRQTKQDSNMHHDSATLDVAKHMQHWDARKKRIQRASPARDWCANQDEIATFTITVRRLTLLQHIQNAGSTEKNKSSALHQCEIGVPTKTT
jgi:hypothetical protein